MSHKVKEKEIEEILTKIRFENNENDLSRIPLEEERYYLDQIRQGKYQEVDFIDFDELKPAMGKSTKNAFKMFEYITVSAIALSTRAAIEGGLAADQAFDLSDAMLQRLERADTLEEMYAIIELTGIILAHEVYRTKRSKGLYLIEQIKNYVSRHIFRRIYLREIAEYVGMSPEHISRMFSEHEKCTLQEYIQKEKMDVACNLLRFSDASLAEISQYMGYQSQSNFSALFKKWKGQSPSEYRNQNKSPLYSE